jgi:hypothetical protein
MLGPRRPRPTRRRHDRSVGRTRRGDRLEWRDLARGRLLLCVRHRGGRRGSMLGRERRRPARQRYRDRVVDAGVGPGDLASVGSAGLEAPAAGSSPRRAPDRTGAFNLIGHAPDGHYELRLVSDAYAGAVPADLDLWRPRSVVIVARRSRPDRGPSVLVSRPGFARTAGPFSERPCLRLRPARRAGGAPCAPRG